MEGCPRREGKLFIHQNLGHYLLLVTDYPFGQQDEKWGMLQHQVTITWCPTQFRGKTNGYNSVTTYAFLANKTQAKLCLTTRYLFFILFGKHSISTINYPITSQTYFGISTRYQAYKLCSWTPCKIRNQRFWPYVTLVLLYY